MKQNTSEVFIIGPWRFCVIDYPIAGKFTLSCMGSRSHILWEVELEGTTLEHAKFQAACKVLPTLENWVCEARTFTIYNGENTMKHKTICVNCKHHVYYGVKHMCQHARDEDDKLQDYVTGKTYYRCPNCRDLNQGNCPNFEKVRNVLPTR